VNRPVRVLVVDDSAFARKVLRDVLAASPRIEVVGIARDGLEALEKIAALKPDVVTLDLLMPNLDGLGVLRALPAEGAPRVVVVSMSDVASDVALEALALGAVDLVHKPTALATDRLYELQGELLEKVLAAAEARPAVAVVPTANAVEPAHASTVAPLARAAASRARVLVVGTSTGGPQALTRLLRALPADFPIPIAVVVHIPVEYTRSLAERLDDVCRVRVAEASEHAPLRPGLAFVARGGLHLSLRPQGGEVLCHLDTTPLDAQHRPSVDVLFESAANAYGAGTLGVVLTGMGDDGLRGARRIREAGGQVLTESESSCVVYGMPRVVFESGLSDGRAPIDGLAALVLASI
jgi:two-component system chemotaxis response regulator CheB